MTDYLVGSGITVLILGIFGGLWYLIKQSADQASTITALNAGETAKNTEIERLNELKRIQELQDQMARTQLGQDIIARGDTSAARELLKKSLGNDSKPT